jgi:branched-chain amino acid transport system permease protein
MTGTGQTALSRLLGLNGPAGTDLRRANRIKGWEILFWTLPLVGWFLFPEDLFLLTQIAIFAIFALSLDMLLGVAGVLTLGHAAFLGLGAYTAGMLPAYLGIGDPLVGLAASTALAAAAGALTSPLILRGDGLSQLMVSIGINAMLFEAANKATSFTGGVDGLSGVFFSPLLGIWDFDLWGRTGYVYAMVLLFLVFLVCRMVLASPYGVSLRAIHQNPARMPALGVGIKGRLTLVWILAAAMAGLAGGLMTQVTQFVSLSTLGLDKSAEVLLMLILGGTGRLYGAIIGATAYMVLHNVLSGLDPEYWQLWIGIIFIGLVLFVQGGILGALDRVLGLIQAKGQTKGGKA